MDLRRIKTIELRGGPGNGRRIRVAYGLEQAMVPVHGANNVETWAVYRPTSERCADWTEIWDEYVKPEFGDTSLGDEQALGSRE
jgi:hypothetical protein